MIKPILHFFKIHWEMIFGNLMIVVQNMFGITPKPSSLTDGCQVNVVNVVFIWPTKSLITQKISV
jgi:hypothetical protein